MSPSWRWRRGREVEITFKFLKQLPSQIGEEDQEGTGGVKEIPNETRQNSLLCHSLERFGLQDAAWEHQSFHPQRWCTHCYESTVPLQCNASATSAGGNDLQLARPVISEGVSREFLVLRARCSQRGDQNPVRSQKECLCQEEQRQQA